MPRMSQLLRFYEEKSVTIPPTISIVDKSGLILATHCLLITLLRLNQKLFAYSSVLQPLEPLMRLSKSFNV